MSRISGAGIASYMYSIPIDRRSFRKPKNYQWNTRRVDNWHMLSVPAKLKPFLFQFRFSVLVRWDELENVCNLRSWNKRLERWKADKNDEKRWKQKRMAERRRANGRARCDEWRRSENEDGRVRAGAGAGGERSGERRREIRGVSRAESRGRGRGRRSRRNR